MRDTTEYGLIGRGFYGWHASGFREITPGGSSTCSSSGGSLATYTAKAREGCLVYDAKACESIPDEHHAFIDLVIKGPMVCVDLPPMGSNKFTDAEAARRMLPGLQGGFKTLAMLALAGFSSLDQVGVEIYANMLRTLPHCRIGWVRGGVVEWENR